MTASTPRDWFPGIARVFSGRTHQHGGLDLVVPVLHLRNGG